jgi:hypothetical protein
MYKPNIPVVMMISGIILIGLSLFLSTTSSTPSTAQANNTQNTVSQNSPSQSTTTHANNPTIKAVPDFQSQSNDINPQTSIKPTTKATSTPIKAVSSSSPTIGGPPATTTPKNPTPQPTQPTATQNTSDNTSSTLTSLEDEFYIFYYPSNYTQSDGISDGDTGFEYSNRTSSSNQFASISLIQRKSSVVDDTEVNESACRDVTQEPTITEISVNTEDFIECRVKAKAGTAIKEYRGIWSFGDEESDVYNVIITYNENTPASTIQILRSAQSSFEIL